MVICGMYCGCMSYAKLMHPATEGIEIKKLCWTRWNEPYDE